MHLSREYTILIVAQQFDLSPRHLIVEVSRSHTFWHTQSIEVLWMNDQHITEATTYTHNRRRVWTSMPSVGFELAIPAIKRPETYTLDHPATGFREFTCILFVIAIARELVSLGKWNQS